MGIILPINNTSAGDCKEAYCRIGKIEAVTFEHQKVTVKLLGYKDKATADAKKAAWESDQANQNEEDYETQYIGAGCVACPVVQLDLTKEERDHMLSIIYGAARRAHYAKGIGEQLDLTKATDVLEEGQTKAEI